MNKECSLDQYKPMDDIATAPIRTGGTYNYSSRPNPVYTLGKHDSGDELFFNENKLRKQQNVVVQPQWNGAHDKNTVESIIDDYDFVEEGHRTRIE